MSKEPPALLTIRDVCAELGVSRSTFYEWRVKHRAPRCIKLPNGEVRVRRAELERWLDGLEEGNGSTDIRAVRREMRRR